MFKMWQSIGRLSRIDYCAGTLATIFAGTISCNIDGYRGGNDSSRKDGVTKIDFANHFNRN